MDNLIISIKIIQLLCKWVDSVLILTVEYDAILVGIIYEWTIKHSETKLNC